MEKQALAMPDQIQSINDDITGIKTRKRKIYGSKLNANGGDCAM